MEICNKNECTGCLACVNCCGINAITIEQDNKGFYIPRIDEDKCVKCMKCVKICPANNTVKEKSFIPQVYAMWSKDNQLRMKSTSGGVFSGLASWVLNNNGVVFGAIFNDEKQVIHSKATRSEELEKMRGSKYVQSYIGETYREAKLALDEGKKVLFTGVPCQIAGLYSFLGKEYENLYTMDIICHGVPSPRAFKDYVDFMEKKEGSPINNILFRAKKPSWTVFSMNIKYKNGNEYLKDAYHDPYLVGFLDDYLTRECCHTCKYTREKRVSDITAADFWSYVSMKKSERNDEKGISLVVVNSEKGESLFKIINKDYIVIERTMKEAKRGNRCLTRPYNPAENKEEFWRKYNENNNFIEAAKEFFPKKKKSLKHDISEVINKNYYLLPKVAKISLDKYLNKKGEK